MLTFSGVLHVFFLAIPIWLVSTVLYIILAGRAGAKANYSEKEEKEKQLQEQLLIEVDQVALKAIERKIKRKRSPLSLISGILAALSLLIFLGGSVWVFMGNMTLDFFKNLALGATIIYFITSLYFIKDMK